MSVRGVLVLGALLLAPVMLSAQEARPPVTLVVEPGEVVTGFMDRPPLEKASMQVLARFLTVVPLVGRRVSIPLAVEWTPLKTEGGRLGRGQDNTPSFLWGLTAAAMDNKYLRFDMSVLFDYAPDPTGSSNYAHQLGVEGDLHVRVGRWLGLPGNWLRLSTYTALRYQITGRPASETNPAFHRAVLRYGLSLPVAPWGYR